MLLDGRWRSVPTLLITAFYIRGCQEKHFSRDDCRNLMAGLTGKPCTITSGLLVTDLFHAIDNLTVEPFLNGDVRHGCSRCSSVPVLLAGREPDRITGPDLFDRSAVALDAAAAGCDDQLLHLMAVSDVCCYGDCLTAGGGQFFC
jgi:hypothetical protein